MTATIGSKEQTRQQTTAAELLERIRDLVPLFRANAAQTESDQRVAAENIEALRAAGMFRLTVPAQFGGYQLALPHLLEIIYEAGRGCASTGWILANDAASTTFALGFAEDALRDMFGANPDALVYSTSNIPGSSASKVDGGYRFSGKFPWSSGCEFSDWVYIALAPLIEGESEPTKLIIGVAPNDQVTVQQTWNCAGMNGTGTHTVIIDDLFVPEHRTLVIDVSPEHRVDEDERHTAVMRGSLQSLAALVGAAQGALDTVTAALAKRRPISLTTYSAAVDSPTVQIWYAEAAHLIDSAKLHMMHAGVEIDRFALEEPVPWVERARIRCHLASALGRAREGVDKLLDVAGASGFALSNPLQRYWRDLNVGSRHNAFNAPIIIEEYSRALLELRPSVTLTY
jgi:alkylation response protein AidB-like acyl-CoA dehydrogenase